ncbi:Lrp/AsnC family transcriptional regulator [Aureibacillus halotolerans]|uniref:DNA-binding Lrp family transcriptional regulator n=1 Tax=Aureibacillus halotolerans TaxID=1508390 RepID=A0A4R6U4R7_9BACI|nr:Lrp/AsnC family transcriptional regulator [Aureibacillus halotolerans]TDQ40706.1 DNA-binding Lrp family transcriptional regulator [Aureibacillus halotolerans]
MDSTDAKILKLLQTNARRTIADIGKLINMTQPAVKERVRKLEEKGVISSYGASLSPSKLGKETTAFVLFQTNSCEKFIDFCESHPDVIDLHRISGQHNYLVKVVTESTRSLDEFTDACGQFGFSTSLIVLSTPFEHKPLLPNNVEV